MDIPIHDVAEEVEVSSSLDQYGTSSKEHTMNNCDLMEGEDILYIKEEEVVTASDTDDDATWQRGEEEVDVLNTTDDIIPQSQRHCQLASKRLPNETNECPTIKDEETDMAVRSITVQPELPTIKTWSCLEQLMKQKDPDVLLPKNKELNKSGNIKRPMNAFMVWSKQYRPYLAAKMLNNTNSEISVRLGQIWNKMSEEEKQPYYNEAGRLKQEHKLKYPDWVYRPVKKNKKEDVSCNSFTPWNRGREVGDCLKPRVQCMFPAAACTQGLVCRNPLCVENIQAKSAFRTIVQPHISNQEKKDYPLMQYSFVKRNENDVSKSELGRPPTHSRRVKGAYERTPSPNVSIRHWERSHPYSSPSTIRTTQHIHDHCNSCKTEKDTNSSQPQNMSQTDHGTDASSYNRGPVHNHGVLPDPGIGYNFPHYQGFSGWPLPFPPYPLEQYRQQLATRANHAGKPFTPGLYMMGDYVDDVRLCGSTMFQNPGNQQNHQHKEPPLRMPQLDMNCWARYMTDASPVSFHPLDNHHPCFHPFYHPPPPTLPANLLMQPPQQRTAVSEAT